MLAIAMLLAIAGCGGSSGSDANGTAGTVNAAGTNGSAGGTGSPSGAGVGSAVAHCTASGSGTCTEWTPFPAISQSCASLGGTLTETACATTNRIGQCTIQVGLGQASVVVSESYYSGRDPSVLRADCEANNNAGIGSATWTDG